MACHCDRMAGLLVAIRQEIGASRIGHVPNGRSIVTACRDGTALVWDVSDLAGRPVTEPPETEMFETSLLDIALDIKTAMPATSSLRPRCFLAILTGQEADSPKSLPRSGVVRDILSRFGRLCDE
jgi:hypothetical protein